MTTTTELHMTDLVAGFWTADEDGWYKGYAHSERTWNGWRVCYFTDDEITRIVEDIRRYELDWFLTQESDDEILEVTPEGETITFARAITVDGVRLWDTSEGGWTWVEAIDGCCGCGDEFPVTELTDQTREGYDPAKVMVCKECLAAESADA